MNMEGEGDLKGEWVTLRMRQDVVDVVTQESYKRHTCT